MALRALLLATFIALVSAQGQGCLPLQGSTQCPGYSAQFINPSALADDYPFLANVQDVSSFDSALAAYVAGPFRTLKYNTQFGCANTTSAYTLQYATTVLCSVFTQQSFAAGCADSSIVNRMACQSTCLQYATSQNFLVADPVACGTTNLAGPARQSNLTYDFTTCTDWTSLISNNTATCVLGQNNEGNCGFGSNTQQLCDHCNPALRGGFRVDSCCGNDNANLASCGYTLIAAQIAPSPTPSSMSQMPTATGIQTSSGFGLGAGSDGGGPGRVDGSSGLSGGAIAGIVVGAIVGLLLLLLLLFFCLKRRRRDNARTGSGQRALLSSSKGSPIIDNEKGYDSSAGGSKGDIIGGTAPFGFTKGKKADRPLPSPASSGTRGFNSSDSAAFHGSGKSSPTSSFGLGGPIAGVGAAAAMTAGASKRDSDKPRPLSQDTTGTGGTGGSNERNLVPSVRDQYSNADIVPGSEVVAIYAYTPNLPDELKLEPDSVVVVRKIYDDGWAVGQISKSDGTTQEGAFPLVVCTVVGADSGDNASSNSSEGASSSNAAYTARENARSSGSHLPRSSTSGRTSSVGGTSFESAQSGTTGNRSGRRGFLSGLMRR